MYNDQSSPPSQNEDAERLLGSLNYHLRMLGELIPFMVQFDADGPSILANACLESFLTHARLLIEFIAGRQGRNPLSRTHSRLDFQPTALGLVDWKLTVPTYFDGYLDLIDKHVAHLSRERVKGAGARWWAFEKMAKSLFFEYGILADRLVVEGMPQYAIPIKTGISQAEEIMARTIPLG
jgi:hypothetical protein